VAADSAPPAAGAVGGAPPASDGRREPPSLALPPDEPARRADAALAFVAAFALLSMFAWTPHLFTLLFYFQKNHFGATVKTT